MAKTVLITGCSAGIGRAAAEMFARMERSGNDTVAGVCGGVGGKRECAGDGARCNGR